MWANDVVVCMPLGASACCSMVFILCSAAIALHSLIRGAVCRRMRVIFIHCSSVFFFIFLLFFRPTPLIFFARVSGDGGSVGVWEGVGVDVLQVRGLFVQGLGVRG